MLLKSEMNGWDVQYGTGEKIGTVRDLVVNTTARRWPVTGIVLTHGLSHRRRCLDVPTDELAVEARDHRLVRRGRTPIHEEAVDTSTPDHLVLGSLEGAKVYSRDEQYLGRAYDFAISTAPAGGWLVWKFLVRPSDARSARLRLRVGDIAEISRDRIVLKASKDELPDAR